MWGNCYLYLYEMLTVLSFLKNCFPLHFRILPYFLSYLEFFFFLEKITPVIRWRRDCIFKSIALGPR